MKENLVELLLQHIEGLSKEEIEKLLRLCIPMFPPC